MAYQEEQSIFEAYIHQDNHITNPDHQIMFLDGKLTRVERIGDAGTDGRIKANAAKLQGKTVYHDPEDGFFYAMEYPFTNGRTHSEQIRSLLNSDEYVLGPDFITADADPAYDYALHEGDAFPIYTVPKNLVGKTIELKEGKFRGFTVRILGITPDFATIEIPWFGKKQKTQINLKELLQGI